MSNFCFRDGQIWHEFSVLTVYSCYATV